MVQAVGNTPILGIILIIKRTSPLKTIYGKIVLDIIFR